MSNNVQNGPRLYAHRNQIADKAGVHRHTAERWADNKKVRRSNESKLESANDWFRVEFEKGLGTKDMHSGMDNPVKQFSDRLWQQAIVLYLYLMQSDDSDNDLDA
jgi:hypothetical protein